ncbi:LytTR family DNA-binding domain-containing protein [Sphingomonas sp. GCM10030256]|uniref:LytTR family DNA-binding domain-containing protein n=1 Tax=Sphingomonas sp. GCM10030256 TaxID=3273427 RepID=UPI00361448C4
MLLGFAGPFGGDPPLSAPVRYAFWMGMVLAGYAAALAAEKLVPRTSGLRPGLRLGAVVIGSALPLTFVAAWAISLVRPGHALGPLRLLALFGPVVVVQLAIVFTLLRSPRAPLLPPSPEGRTRSGASTQALLWRLPNRLGKQIIALEAEDHYLRVHTTLGSDLVLMRLSDAIAAIGPDVGFQAHRSWWVAHEAVAECLRSQQRTYLKLTNGQLVPVGRTYSAAVRSRTAHHTVGA